MTVAQNELEYTLLSDPSLELARALGIAYKVESTYLQQLQSFGIDLGELSGESHDGLPVPGVFILDKDARVKFHFVHPDHRVRVSADVVLAAAKAALEK